MSLKQDLSTTGLMTPVPGISTTRVSRSSRNLFVLKSLSVILILTFLVLGINYYLISNCPKDEEQHVVSIGDNQSAIVLPITVSVYYEILCPDSKHFILKQLIPVWRKYINHLNVRLVPFGKGNVAERSGTYQFTCQHGAEECHGNKLHACLIENYGNASIQMDVIGCSMERFRLWGATIKDIDEVMSECIKEKIPDNKHELICPNADKLLATHGYETLALRPRVTFIPTISIDNSVGNQATILRNLDGVICKILNNRNSEIKC
ncbi:unnamed protein product [Orchesella dallaii]|uniref:Gamma-interferon-inducible lysosomal thiol reductase n=1 Tax=Orchesella dallaii TaxID=48710 RepID=A0ABP1QM96_9HEXA